MVAKAKMALGLVAVAALVAVGVYANERFVRRSALRFPYLTGQISDARYAELASAPGWSKVSADVEPGVSLNGLLRKPAQPGARWVLFFSGNDGAMLARGQSVLSRLAGDEPWGLAVFAYRGFESSGGVPELDALAADASRIVDLLVERHGAVRDKLHVVGFSIGGHLAVRAVAAQCASGKPIRSLALLASVNDIVMFRRSPWQKLSLGDAYRTQPFLEQVPEPVLVLQGTADEALGGPGQGRDIAAALGGRAEYVELAGVGHEALLDSEQAITKVRQFIAR